MKEENGGLVGKALGALLNVIATITGFKAILEGLLGKAAAAVGAILKDPIGFIGKLIHAVGAGFKQFVGNIAGWLTKGLKTWLFGTLVKAGIDLPETWDLKGILQLIMGILGPDLGQHPGSDRRARRRAGHEGAGGHLQPGEEPHRRRGRWPWSS